MVGALSNLGVYIAPELDKLRPEKRQWFEQLAEAMPGEPRKRLEDIPNNQPIIVGPTFDVLKFISYRIRNECAPVFYWDRGYFSRNAGDPKAAMHRIVVNALQKNFISNHMSNRIPPPAMKPWRGDGDKIVILDHSNTAIDFLGLHDWAITVAYRLSLITDRPVEIRKKGDAESLIRDIQDAWATVTYSSNAAVESILEGVPAIVAGSSACAPICSTSLEEIENPKRVFIRDNWLRSLGWGQFTFDEMLAGAPFEITYKTWMENVDSRIVA